MYIGINLTVFLCFQIIAALLFKWGSAAPDRYWWGFAFGNLFGASSIITLINLYKVIPPNLNVALTTGGSFLLIQLAIATVYRTQPHILQWAGIGLIVAGIALVALFQPKLV